MALSGLHFTVTTHAKARPSEGFSLKLMLGALWRASRCHFPGRSSKMLKNLPADFSSSGECHRQHLTDNKGPSLPTGAPSFHLMPGSSLLSHVGKPHTTSHRRYGVVTEFGMGQVGPPRYGRRAILCSVRILYRTRCCSRFKTQSHTLCMLLPFLRCLPPVAAQIIAYQLNQC